LDNTFDNPAIFAIIAGAIVTLIGGFGTMLLKKITEKKSS
jgi:predicted Rossmann-fold nucleotide-binding protein